jgi:hypothetical protein
VAGVGVVPVPQNVELVVLYLMVPPDLQTTAPGKILGLEPNPEINRKVPPDSISIPLKRYPAVLLDEISTLP